MPKIKIIFKQIDFGVAIRKFVLIRYLYLKKRYTFGC